MAVRLLKNRTRALPTAGYVEVTPDMATEWLESAARNRNLNARRVDMYTAAMKRGDWMLTSQGIAFDETGKLIDGQHRLSAIVKADIPITMLVVNATSSRSQLVTDMGLKRTPHDQIGLRNNWEVMPVHIAVAKSMITSVGGVGEKQRRAVLTDIQRLDRYYTRHRRAVEFAVEYTWRHKTGHVGGVILAPVMAPIARAAYTQDNQKLIRFAEVVTTGMADRPGDSPAVILRNWLLAMRDKGLSSRAYGDRYIIYKKTEIALNAFLRGESIERLGQRHLEVELFPIPADIVIKLGKAEEDDDAGIVSK
jgi:hypothetical protein